MMILKKERPTHRNEALAELTREADEIFKKQADGEIDTIEAEARLEKLRRRYETPLDRFISAAS